MDEIILGILIPDSTGTGFIFHRFGIRYFLTRHVILISKFSRHFFTSFWKSFLNITKCIVNIS